MKKTLLTALALALLVVPVRADEIDPEPKRTGAVVAKSDDHVVRAYKNGDVVGSNKKGEVLWRFASRIKADKPATLLISNEKVVFAQADNLSVLDLKTGKAYWSRSGNVKDAKITVNGNSLSLRGNNRGEVIDLQSGKVTEIFQFKR